MGMRTFQFHPSTHYETPENTIGKHKNYIFMWIGSWLPVRQTRRMKPVLSSSCHNVQLP